MTEQTNAKPEGKCAKLHAMWQKTGGGALLPRAFAIELAVAEGVNPSTARTQYQIWFKRMQQVETVEPSSAEPPAEPPVQ